METSGSIIGPDALLLIAGKGAATHSRPVLGLADKRSITDAELGVVVPIRQLLIEGDVAVYKIHVLSAIVIEVTKLRTKAPATIFQPKRICLVLVEELAWFIAIFGNPDVIALLKEIVFPNVRNLN